MTYLPSVNAIAETIGVQRDLAIVELTGVKYHFDQLSTSRALDPLKLAKRDGLDVTAGASIHHLTLNEMDIGDYRTFFKIKPPLRSEDDHPNFTLSSTGSIKWAFFSKIFNAYPPFKNCRDTFRASNSITAILTATPIST